MSLLSDLAEYLEEEGVGTRGQDLFTYYMLDEPVECLCLYESGGRPPTDAHDGAMTRRPNLQVVARGLDPEAVRARLQQVEGELHGLSNAQLTGTFIISVLALGSATPMGRESRVSRMSQNYVVEWS